MRWWRGRRPLLALLAIASATAAGYAWWFIEIPFGMTDEAELVSLHGHEFFPLAAFTALFWSVIPRMRWVDRSSIRYLGLRQGLWIIGFATLVGLIPAGIAAAFASWPRLAPRAHMYGLPATSAEQFFAPTPTLIIVCLAAAALALIIHPAGIALTEAASLIVVVSRQLFGDWPSCEAQWLICSGLAAVVLVLTRLTSGGCTPLWVLVWRKLRLLATRRP